MVHDATLHVKPYLCTHVCVVLPVYRFDGIWCAFNISLYVPCIYCVCYNKALCRLFFFFFSSFISHIFASSVPTHIIVTNELNRKFQYRSHETWNESYGLCAGCIRRTLWEEYTGIFLSYWQTLLNDGNRSFFFSFLLSFVLLIFNSFIHLDGHVLYLTSSIMEAENECVVMAKMQPKCWLCVGCLTSIVSYCTQNGVNLFWRKCGQIDFCATNLMCHLKHV